MNFCIAVHSHSFTLVAVRLYRRSYSSAVPSARPLAPPRRSLSQCYLLVITSPTPGLIARRPGHNYIKPAGRAAAAPLATAPGTSLRATWTQNAPAAERLPSLPCKLPAARRSCARCRARRLPVVQPSPALPCVVGQVRVISKCICYFGLYNTNTLQKMNNH